jgi:hypothetical protein
MIKQEVPVKDIANFRKEDKEITNEVITPVLSYDDQKSFPSVRIF